VAQTDIASEQASPANDRRSARREQQTVQVIHAFSLGVMIYGLLLWIYVAICGLLAPATLKLPLTHLIPFLREDTSGALGFLFSFAAFVAYRLNSGKPSSSG
jgi:hypothetical protein